VCAARKYPKQAVLSPSSQLDSGLVCGIAYQLLKSTYCLVCESTVLVILINSIVPNTDSFTLCARLGGRRMEPARCQGLLLVMG